jgi:hypothetical protein
MANIDPTSDRSAREVSALLRDARSLLRRADKLFATGLATEVRTATEQLVHHLTRLEEQSQHLARDALRRRR